MAGHAVISHDVLASYAADAATGTPGVRQLVDGPRRHRGVRVTEEDGTIGLEVHVSVDWGRRADDVGADVQQRVHDYVGRTAKLGSFTVEVVIAAVATPRR